MIKEYLLNGHVVKNYCLDECVGVILTPIASETGKTIHTINMDHLDKLLNLKNTEFNSAYQHCDIVTLDSRILKTFLKLRYGVPLNLCTGSDLTHELFRQLHKHHDTKICIVGGDETTLNKLIANFYLQNEIKQHIPPMGFVDKPEEFEKVLSFVNREFFNIVFLAVGCPQQEILAAYLKRHSSQPTYYLCIGASIDFLTGRQSRAPQTIQRLHMEWAHRLIQDPGRMAKRYLSNFKVLFRILFERKC